MPVVNETKIKDDIKNKRFDSIYFLFGQESFLVKTYADRIKNAVLGENAVDINLLELNGNPDLSLLSDHMEALPFFSDHKVIMINDFNPEKVTEDETEQFISMLKSIPDTTVLIFYLTGCTFSLRSQRVKKIFEEIKKYSSVCEFKPLSQKETANIIYKKIQREKRIISPENANYLAEITACDLNLASAETTKLCCYADEGKEITREIIDRMVEKRLETKIFTLSDAMISGNGQRAFQILNDLFEQRVDPIPILATLSSAYSEYYTAKAAKCLNISPQKAAADLGYTGIKASFFAKKFNAAASMKMENLRSSMKIIFEADTKLKSAKVNGRLLLEETVLKLMTLYKERKK